MMATVDTRLLDIRGFPIPISFYTNVEYNNERRTRLMLLDASIKSIGCGKLESLIPILEECAYEYAKKICTNHNHGVCWTDYRFNKSYHYGANKIQQLIQNRRDIVDRLLSGDINPHDLLSLPIHIIYKEKVGVWKLNKIRTKQRVIAKVTSDVECPRCGQREAIQHEVQTRGADEESTSKFQCQVCRNRWVEND